MSAQVPTRLLVLQRLTEHLEGITKFAGYDYDLAGKVKRGRNLIGVTQSSDCDCGLPMLSILESPRPDFAVYAGQDDAWRKDNWVLLLQGLIEDEKQCMHPSDKAYEFAAAVEGRLGRLFAEDPNNGYPKYIDEYGLAAGDYLHPLITTLQIAPPVVRPPDGQVSALAFFYLPIRVGVAVDTESPYTAVP